MAKQKSRANHGELEHYKAHCDEQIEALRLCLQYFEGPRKLRPALKEVAHRKARETVMHFEKFVGKGRKIFSPKKVLT